MFKCEKCASELEPNAKFCTNCGEQVSENVKTAIKNEQPSSKVKIWLLKAVAFFIAAFVFSIARFIITAINGGSIDGKLEAGGILLFIGMYVLLKGLFLKDSSAKKWGGWILVIYIVLSIVFSYYMNNSQFGVESQIMKMNKNTPKKIDDDTLLLKASLKNSNVVSFRYKLINVSSENFSKESKQIFNKKLEEKFCANESFNHILKYKNKIIIFIKGKDNRQITNLYITNEKCKNYK